MYRSLAARNEAAVPGSAENAYGFLVNKKIRAKYSQSAVEAIFRKALLGDQEELTAFNEFVESCKLAAKIELGL